jgi:hypothetical protein
MSRLPCLVVILLALLLGQVLSNDLGTPSRSVFPDLYEASVEELQSGLEAGHFTSVDLVKVSTTVPSMRTVELISTY